MNNPTNPNPAADSHGWSYSEYRAALRKDGRLFAIVTPDGNGCLAPEQAHELLRALNRSTAAPSVGEAMNAYNIGIRACHALTGQAADLRHGPALEIIAEEIRQFGHAAVQAETEKLKAERDEAREWCRRLQRDSQTLTCVYYGKEYPPGSPAHGSEVLTQHIRACEKHPMRAAEAETQRLRVALAEARGLLDLMNIEVPVLKAELNTAKDQVFTWAESSARYSEQLHDSKQDRDRYKAALDQINALPWAPIMCNAGYEARNIAREAINPSTKETKS